MKLRTNVSFGIFAFLLFLIAGIYITYPLIFHLRDYTTGIGDELLIAWIHAWVIHGLFTQPFDLFNATLFYPSHNSLAFSDFFLTGSLLTALPVYLLREPIVANNITIISSLILVGFSLYLLSFYLTKNFFASLLSGMLVIFSSAFLSYRVHIQVIEIYWVPLALLCLLKFLDTNKRKYFLLFLGCFLLQTYNSFLPGYFIVFSALIILLFQWLHNKKIIKQVLTRQNIFFLFLTFVFLIPVTIPYFQVSREFQYVRDIRDAIHFAMQPEDLLYPGDTTKLHDFLIKTIPTNHYSQNNEFKASYLGLVFSLLVIIALVYLIKQRRVLDWKGKSFLTISVLGFILSLGPFLHLNRQTIHHPFPIPLPYALFYYVLPGFQGFRTSVRWEVLFMLGMAIVIAMVFAKLIKPFSNKTQLLLTAILLFGIIFEFNFPLHYQHASQKNEFPHVYSWLATTAPTATIVEMPIYNWNMFPYASEEQIRDYYNIMYFRKTINGASGFSPPPWQTFVIQLLAEFPDQTSITKLKEQNITYIIVHKTEYDTLAKNHFAVNGKFMENGDAVLSELRQNKNILFVKEFDDDYVFRIK